MRTPEINEILHSIFVDYSFPVIDKHGNTNLMLSRDVGCDFNLHGLRIAEEYVEHAARSPKALDIDKTMAGFVLQKSYPLAKLFYDLSGCPKGRTNPPRYEVSEAAKILSAAANNVGLHIAPITADPLSWVANGLLEGDLVNALATRVHESTKRRSYKEAFRARQKEVSQKITKVKRYFARLSSNYPGLCAVHIEVGYPPECANTMTVEETHTHREKFVESLSNGPIVGWWSKREYRSETGYHFHFFLFLDGHKIQFDHNLFSDLGRMWDSASGNKGTLFLQQSYLSNPEYIHTAIALKLKRDLYLRLEGGDRFPHIDMGPMPTLASHSSCDLPALPVMCTPFPAGLI